MAIKYTEDHEWLDISGDSAIVGITQHAQDALGDVCLSTYRKWAQRLRPARCVWWRDRHQRRPLSGTPG